MEQCAFVYRLACEYNGWCQFDGNYARIDFEQNVVYNRGSVEHMAGMFVVWLPETQMFEVLIVPQNQCSNPLRTLSKSLAGVQSFCHVHLACTTPCCECPEPCSIGIPSTVELDDEAAAFLTIAETRGTEHDKCGCRV